MNEDKGGIAKKACKSTWYLYKPSQSDIIGKKVLSYTKKNNQISLGAVNTRSGKVETTDNPSTATEKQEMEKDFKLDIKGFFNKSTKVTKLIVTNIMLKPLDASEIIDIVDKNI